MASPPNKPANASEDFLSLDFPLCRNRRTPFWQCQIQQRSWMIWRKHLTMSPSSLLLESERIELKCMDRKQHCKLFHLYSVPAANLAMELGCVLPLISSNIIIIIFHSCLVPVTNLDNRIMQVTRIDSNPQRRWIFTDSS